MERSVLGVEGRDGGEGATSGDFLVDGSGDTDGGEGIFVFGCEERAFTVMVAGR